MSPGLVLVSVHVLHLNLLIVGVKAHDLLTYTRSTPVLNLVVEVEDLLACLAPPIVHDVLCHHANHCALPRVHISDYCDSYVIRITV